MAMTSQKSPGKRGLKRIKVGGNRDKERGVVVHHEIVPLKLKGKSVWIWHEDFAREWEKTHSAHSSTDRRRSGGQKGRTGGSGDRNRD